MSDLLPGVDQQSKGAELTAAEPARSVEADGRWSPNDQLMAGLEPHRSIRNPAVVALALGLSLSRDRVSPFIPAGWLAGARLLVPTGAGAPIRAGRLKVMPVFTDAEAAEAWLTPGSGFDHPCFGPPADGVRLVADIATLSACRAEAGAVTIVLNPAGPGGYQIDPEDGALDAGLLPGDVLSDFDSAPGRTDHRSAAGMSVGTHGIDLPPAPSVPLPAPAADLVDPAGRAAVRGHLSALIQQAADLAAAGDAAEAVSTLAVADRLAELLGDYVRRAEMMLTAARLLHGLAHTNAASQLARYAVLASGLCARGRLEMEARRLFTEVS